MASTITLTGDWLQSIGSRQMVQGTGNLGTYATNGVAVTAAQCGLGVLESLVIDSAGGYVFEWDKTNGKVKAYRAASHTHDLFLDNADVSDAAGARVNAGANLLGANTGADITVTGVADTTGDGGIVAIAQAALAEVTNAVSLASVTFRFRAVGY